MQAMIVVIPSPPYMRPASILTISMICPVTPPCSIRVPATTKQGMARSGNELRPSKSALWMTVRGRLEKTNNETMVEEISAM